MSRNNRTSNIKVTAIAASNTVDSPVEFVVAPSVPTVDAPAITSNNTVDAPLVDATSNYQYESPIGPMHLAIPVGDYYVARPNRAVCKHDANDLGRAVSLILQLLPLITENQVFAAQNTKLPMLLPSEVSVATQALLSVAYMLETVEGTEDDKRKVQQKDAYISKDEAFAVMAQLAAQLTPAS